MKKASIPAISLLLCLVLVSSVGCNKIFDKYQPDGKEERKCRIKTFVSQQYFKNASPEPGHFTVYYNTKGNPDSALSTNGKSFSFTYDSNDRLSKYNYHSDEGNRIIDGYHSYYYEGQKIIRDYGWEEAQVVNSDYNFLDTYETNSILSYDVQGRVSEDYVTAIFTHDGDADQSPVPHQINYAYDVNGNLILYVNDSDGNPTAERITYDNKKSYLRTHPVWMFIARN